LGAIAQTHTARKSKTTKTGFGRYTSDAIFVVGVEGGAMGEEKTLAGI